MQNDNINERAFFSHHLKFNLTQTNCKLGNCEERSLFLQAKIEITYRQQFAKHLQQYNYIYILKKCGIYTK